MEEALTRVGAARIREQPFSLATSLELWLPSERIRSLVIFHPSLLCVAEALFPATAVKKSGALFLYPASSPRAETLLREWHTRNTGAPPALTRAH